MTWSYIHGLLLVSAAFNSGCQRVDEACKSRNQVTRDMYKDSPAAQHLAVLRPVAGRASE